MFDGGFEKAGHGAGKRGSGAVAETAGYGHGFGFLDGKGLELSARRYLAESGEPVFKWIGLDVPRGGAVDRANLGKHAFE